MDEFLIIDKPAGLTSFGVIRELKKITGEKKIGHSGTLDPMATGVLVLALGKATKKLANLIKLDKEYEAEIMFGLKSDTYDKEGKVEINDEKLCAGINLDKIKQALKSFTGEILQMPPVYSALKIKGQRACDLVRQGKKVELQARKVQIYKIEILDYKVKKWQEQIFRPVLTLRVHCSSGTYIRSLAHDLGEKLGSGALLFNLRRTQVGDFRIEKAVKMENGSNFRF